MPRLFTDDFLRAVAELRIVARQVPPAGRHAEQRSADRGAGMEFRDFRAYVPGDDLRRVDWNVYRRSGRVFLRLFEEPEDLPVYILLDVSDSMFFDTPPRADAARRMAALLTVVALGQLDRVTIYPCGADLARPFVPTTGPGGLHAALAFLEQLGPAGPTDLPRALQRFAGQRLRSGLLVVISDFFDPRGPAAITAALGRLRHRLLLVQLVRAGDARPALEGEFTLVDCESGSTVEVAATAGALARYQAAYGRFCDELLAFAARRQAAHLRLDTDRPLLQQVGELFRNRVLVT
jgi:uncharacterized protein (DUF58 family)